MIRLARRAPLIGMFGSLSALACASSGTPARSIHALRGEPTSCISTIGADTTVYEVGEIDEKPVFRSAMRLTFPPEALHQRIHGRVVVTAIVNAGGDVDQSSIIIAKRVHPLLDNEARRVVSTATLWPACRNGQAVRTRIAVPFDFAVRNPTIGFWPLFAVGVAGGIAGALLGHAR